MDFTEHVWVGKLIYYLLNILLIDIIDYLCDRSR